MVVLLHIMDKYLVSIPSVFSLVFLTRLLFGLIAQKQF